jgi:class 3 adenylate cyclase
MRHDAEPAEYKQVTVLFADVVGSMDIAGAVGAERLREIMTEVFNRSAATVRRYGGTVDKFTGDGLMAVFGAPIALEAHALRACRAALDIQAEAHQMAADLVRRDALDLRLRIGLNSGEVIAGDIGWGPLAYTAVGAQVGMAQRMESAAPPGGVMVSGSTARLVERVAVMSAPEMLLLKGFNDPLPARRLLVLASDGAAPRTESTFVGRAWEMGALRGVLERSVMGAGVVVGLVGPPGIGKTRMVRELTSLARAADVDVFSTACESHTAAVPFHAAAGLLRAAVGANGLEGETARTAVRSRLSGVGDEDLLSVEDLLGIGDPAAALPPGT